MLDFLAYFFRMVVASSLSLIGLCLLGAVLAGAEGSGSPAGKVKEADSRELVAFFSPPPRLAQPETALSRRGVMEYASRIDIGADAAGAVSSLKGALGSTLGSTLDSGFSSRASLMIFFRFSMLFLLCFFLSAMNLTRFDPAPSIAPQVGSAERGYSTPRRRLALFSGCQGDCVLFEFQE